MALPRIPTKHLKTHACAHSQSPRVREHLQAPNFLVDGAPDDSGLLLQIYTQNLIGPIFFEILQRKGKQSFVEGNFKALFESIERDQIRCVMLAA